MKRYKIYLDTSTISYLDQTDSPEKMAETHMFWERVKAGEFDVYLSEVVFDEISDCSDKKLDILTSKITEIEYKKIPITNEVISLARKIIANGILPKKSVDDSQHIAAAIIGECDYLVSWNMKHLANVRTNDGVRELTVNENYNDISLIPPSMLMRGGNADESGI